MDGRCKDVRISRHLLILIENMCLEICLNLSVSCISVYGCEWAFYWRVYLYVCVCVSVCMYVCVSVHGCEPELEFVCIYS